MTSRRLAGLLLLAALTLALYAPVRNHGFLLYDDDRYITENRAVLFGLSWHGVGQAFASTNLDNWHPLTWVSHMADMSCFGTWAGGHHLVSAGFHAANVVLAAWVVWALTGSWWGAVAVAGVFGLHPLRVESVAWAAERKDVLSGFFFLLGLAAYGWWLRRPSPGRWLQVVAAHGLGLLSKPMVVTFPVVLLVLDFWPLGRLRRGEAARRVGEKAPLVAMSAALGVVTYLAQSRGGSVKDWVEYPFWSRAGNAVVSTGMYLVTFVRPVDLAVFYPHPRGGLSWWLVAVWGVVLAGLTAGAVLARRRAPFLLAGWVWYLVMLAPVIGLVQVGMQARADRYTYLPLVGVTVAVVWGLAGLAGRLRVPPAARVAAVAVVLAALTAGTSRYLAVWRDDEALFRHALAVTRDNYVAHDNLAIALLVRERGREALEHAAAAARLEPKPDPARHVALGRAFARAGLRGAATEEYQRALEIDPGNAAARRELLLLRQRKGGDGSGRPGGPRPAGSR